MIITGKCHDVFVFYGDKPTLDNNGDKNDYFHDSTTDSFKLKEKNSRSKW